MSNMDYILAVNSGLYWLYDIHTVIMKPLDISSMVKFIYSEKAAKFCEIFTLLLTVKKVR